MFQFVYLLNLRKILYRESNPGHLGESQIHRYISWPLDHNGVYIRIAQLCYSTYYWLSPQLSLKYTSQQSLRTVNPAIRVKISFSRQVKVFYEMTPSWVTELKFKNAKNIIDWLMCQKSKKQTSLFGFVIYLQAGRRERERESGQHFSTSSLAIWADSKTMFEEERSEVSSEIIF